MVPKMSYFTVISLHRNYFKLRFHPCRVSGWENVTRQYYGKPALGDTNKLIAGHFLKLTCVLWRRLNIKAHVVDINKAFLFQMTYMWSGQDDTSRAGDGVCFARQKKERDKSSNKKARQPRSACRPHVTMATNIWNQLKVGTDLSQITFTQLKLAW